MEFIFGCFIVMGIITLIRHMRKDKDTVQQTATDLARAKHKLELLENKDKMEQELQETRARIRRLEGRKG